MTSNAWNIEKGAVYDIATMCMLLSLAYTSLIQEFKFLGTSRMTTKNVETNFFLENILPVLKGNAERHGFCIITYNMYIVE